ncbi:hypothetical protein SAMN02745163_04012 [Clostridium cavendishii DSM 21758]|uniref:histidine kinase n=1 Tax=Clostridium cavendishii DSM 21758 TaxID=1121302 RepID=A0A1M6TEV3_9CLOT|nr:HAMP domain-containing sensor histidine kinase [Clostridium cavendishii]SHK55419.1 hypothetical protein SAMN02745163_04012 [Clostridium cavendishii DSM 21758]
MRCFNNRGFWIGLLIGFLIMFLGIAINIKLTDNNVRTLEKSYLDIQANLVGIIGEKDKKYAEEVAILLKENDLNHKELGYEIIDKYGYNASLDKEFLEPINTVYKNLINNNIIFLISFSFCLILLMSIMLNYIYKKMNLLAVSMQESLEDSLISKKYKYLEGDYGKLVFAFDDIRKRLQQSILNLSKEKTFLKNTLSDISHQLKTPLAALKMYNEILIDENLSNEEKSFFLQNSKTQINRMEWLIKNLLKLAKLDTGTIAFNIRNENLKETIEDSLDTLYSKAREKSIVFDLNLCSSYINHDKEWLSEAFINIIKNGLEHTNENGKIEISLIDNAMYSKVSIRDNGVGIDAEELPKIFNRFYKSKNNKNKESVGIGLSLSKSIIEANGGMIEARSEINKGTEFIVTFIK